MGLKFRVAREGRNADHRFKGLVGLVLRASEMEKRMEATRVCSLYVRATAGLL